MKERRCEYEVLHESLVHHSRQYVRGDTLFAYPSEPQIQTYLKNGFIKRAPWSFNQITSMATLVAATIGAIAAILAIFVNQGGT